MQLVTLDVDGTLLPTTVFQAAADELGFGDEVRFFDDLYFRGLISLETTFRAEYDLFLDQPLEDVKAALREAPWLPDIGETVSRLKGQGLDVWVVTDQPDWAVSVLEGSGLEEGIVAKTRRWGDRIGPVEEHAFEKEAALLERLKARGIPAGEVCHVGNGSNDVPVFEAVGLSIAFNPDSKQVAQAADATLESNRLGSVVEILDELSEG